MALIDNMYLFVESENISYTMNVSSNQVEVGVDLTDHAEREPLEFSISGLLLDDERTTAYEQYTKLRNWQLACKQVKYVGRNVFTGIITDISLSNDYTVENGAPVDITLKEIRIANSPYRSSGSRVVQKQVVNTNGNMAVWHTVRKGENLTLIANKYGTTVSSIMVLNTSIKNANLIYAGDKIRVR